ncbi:MAG TPA: molybdopterin cofactor-binding domain-containing protein [Ramlibacter sp.]|uniref:xanthine dehydrogenase family protein molybdopterin-binding subunit n=1 Tax=Ramlibacter sp. TaxID=1917967 RepID=UPI002CF7B32B|nr:molybdopterin cofactor-binding domain-containing protein [Ramlibacter sp.]HVZ42849.1 molybdopterin cofactor-binding domain-containing protein [Ramlibacter sp.]
MTAAPLNRRELLRMLGGGIVVMVAWPEPTGAQTPAFSYPEDVNAYLVVKTDGRVTVLSGKIEMGQGVLTSLAQMAAEELGVALDAVDMVLGDTARCPWDMGTFGSLTTRMFGPALRAAAARARMALIELASRRLGVDAARLDVKDARVFVRGQPERGATYAQLAGGARIAAVVGRKEILRAASQFGVMGTSPQRLDAREKLTGAAKYTGDLRLPGMLHARIVRPPAHGARLVRVDAGAVFATPGARWVNEGEGEGEGEGGLMAVLHEWSHEADAAFARVQAQWDVPPARVDSESIFEHLAATKSAPRVLVDQGKFGPGDAGTRRFDAEYRKGYVAHAPLETHAALADVRDGRATVWASTQTPFPTRDRIARALGLEASAVRVIVPYVGGGFGGKSADAQAVEAARLSRACGRPVRVERTRGEEFFLDTFDPAAVVRIASSLDTQGRIASWRSRVFGCGDRGAAVFYDIPNLRVEVMSGASYASEQLAEGAHPLAVGPWRAPGANMNVYAIESHMDTMAAAAGVDPVEFRLRHLRDERMRRVLRAAADAFGWKPSPAPSGRGFGVACSVDAGTCVATIAHVAVDAKSGAVRALRLVCAQDMGIVVNPEGAKMQIEGGLAMGLGYTLSEEVRFQGGDVLDRNFDTYRIPRFSDMPRIEAILVRNDDLAPQGGGEPSITTAGASLANAVFDAAGARVLRLPMTPERVRRAVSA